ncbi:MAG: hypothetical protein ACU0BB_05080 [Paracoccaceae bacterium]
MLHRSRKAWDSLFPLILGFKSRLGLGPKLDYVPPLALVAPMREPRPAFEHFLDIPVKEQTNDDQACQSAQTRGQFLARQDRWEDLSREMRDADAARLTTPGGMPVSELLAFGARSDAVNAVEHALQAGDSDLPMTDGIQMLEEVRQEYLNDPFITLVVALAHLDIAWAWRGTSCEKLIPHENREVFLAHFDRARALTDPFCFIELNSPILASASCALLTGEGKTGQQIADIYEDLIDLDPHNHRHMRALGNHMLPRWFGSYEQLELESRRTASRQHDIWGAGGYTWVYFDAIAVDDTACANVDVPFFLDGLHDIIDARPGQEMVNLLAAYCAVAVKAGSGLNEEADLKRSEISEASSWLIRDHLTELHPLIWAHAADGFDNNASITSASRFAARGRADALRIIADLFHEELSNGMRIIFTPDGPRMQPA